MPSKGGTDAVMLSGETAVGDYPVQTVRAMARICETIEEGTLAGQMPVPFVAGQTTWHRQSPRRPPRSPRMWGQDHRRFHGVGSTARLISKYRPTSEWSPSPRNTNTRRRMALYWGIQPHAFERHEYTDDEMAAAAEIL